MAAIYRLGPTVAFPAVDGALDEPNGLLAAGGALTPEWLMTAYRSGIFPWFEEGQPVLWWSPDPRAVLLPGNLRITRSLRKSIRNGGFEISFDTDFDRVIRHCQAPREYAEGTWITEDMRSAYRHLHQLGYAHSVEVSAEGEIIGGLYGVAIGRLFFGESMFHQRRDASKVAFAALNHLCRKQGCPFIDCQLMNPHLASLGATEIPRDDFIRALRDNIERPPNFDWTDVNEAVTLTPEAILDEL